VSSVVALQKMIRWGNFKPDGLFCYDIGNTLSGAKTIMCVPGSVNYFSCTFALFATHHSTACLAITVVRSF
jgi:hypothetical protein